MRTLVHDEVDALVRLTDAAENKDITTVEGHACALGLYEYRDELLDAVLEHGHLLGIIENLVQFAPTGDQAAVRIALRTYHDYRRPRVPASVSGAEVSTQERK